MSYLLIPYIGAGIFGAPIWAHVADRVGKHRAIQIACVAYGITQTILMAIRRSNSPPRRSACSPSASRPAPSSR